MLILSQDEKIIVNMNCNNFYISENPNGSATIYAINKSIYDKPFAIGLYSSTEDAKEVMKDIGKSYGVLNVQFFNMPERSLT